MQHQEKFSTSVEAKLGFSDAGRLHENSFLSC